MIIQTFVLKKYTPNQKDPQNITADLFWCKLVNQDLLTEIIQHRFEIVFFPTLAVHVSLTIGDVGVVDR